MSSELLWINVPTTTWDMSMTLLVSVALKGGGRLFAGDGNVHEYLKDNKKVKIRTADDQQKLFKVAKNVVVGMSGIIMDRELEIFIQDLRDFYQDKDVKTVPEANLKHVRERIQKIFKYEAIALFVIGNQIRQVDKHSTEPISFNYAITFAGVDFPNYKDWWDKFTPPPLCRGKLPTYNEAIEALKEIYVTADKATTVGGLITAFHVKAHSVKYLGTLLDLRHNNSMSKEKFDELIRRASQPLPLAQDKPKSSAKNAGKRTRPRKTGDVSAKPRGKSR